MSPPVSYSVGDFALFSVCCLLTVLLETFFEPTAPNTYPDFRCFFSEGLDPIADARRARCPAHVGYIFIECVIIIVLLGRV